jgi:hypothetical protein
MNQTEKDCLTLALRLLGEDPATFAPETAEVMDRWRPKCIEVLSGRHPQDTQSRSYRRIAMQTKLDHRCPYCGKFAKFVWIEMDRWGSSWYWQTGLLDGYWICEHCGREM